MISFLNLKIAFPTSVAGWIATGSGCTSVEQSDGQNGDQQGIHNGHYPSYTSTSTRMPDFSTDPNSAVRSAWYN